MKASRLKVGDRIRIISLPPWYGTPGSTSLPETRRVYERLIARGRSVRIWRIIDGDPWYECRFRMKNGRWDHHWMAVLDFDQNWVPVRSRGGREDTFTSDLLRDNPNFQGLVAKSKAGSRKPFKPSVNVKKKSGGT